MTPATAGDTIVEEITITAPAERIFAALSDPGERVRWWSAEGRFKATDMESDLRPGGRWLMRGIGVGGRPFTIQGVYRQIERPRVLVFTWRASWQDDSSETVVRFDLEERDGSTRVRVTHSGLVTERARKQHQGWPDLLAALETYVGRQRDGND